MRYEFRVGLGFMFHSKGQSIFIILAIALGVAVQVFIASLITAVQISIIDRVLGDNSHIYIDDGNTRDKLLSLDVPPFVYGNFSKDRNKILESQNIIDSLKNLKDIVNIVPTIEGNAIYSRQGKTTSVSIRGMDLSLGDKIYNVSNRVIEGTPLIDSENILIGTRLAQNYQLKVGDIMDLTLPSGSIEKMRISGIFDLGNQISNTSLIVMDLNKAQLLFNKKGFFTDINIQIKDVFKAPIIAKQIQAEYPDLEVAPWTRDGESILKALQSQTATTLIIQIVVMLATCMSIASVLLVTVVQKIKEIGILKAMGALDRSTGIFFIVQGTAIGFLGSILGIFIGIFLLHLYVTFTSPSFEIPIDPTKMLLILLISTLAGMISGIIPARKCMKLSPIEVIKGE